MGLTRRIVRFLFDSALILAAGAIASAALVNLTPGSDIDDRELNPQYSAETLAKIRAERSRSHSIVVGSIGAFARMMRGDFGVSESSGQPVAALLAERIPVTCRTMAAGAILGFSSGLVVAAFSLLLFPGAAESVASAGFIALLSLPAGLLALIAVFSSLPVELATASAVAPRVYFYCAKLFAGQTGLGYVTGAMAAGIAPLRIVCFQIFPALRSELAALAGFSVVTSLGATIPAEVLSGRPGIGQLAWNGAMQRDLPVVIAVTVLMILVSRAVTLMSALPGRDSGLSS